MTEESSGQASTDLGAQALELARRRQDAANEVLALLERHFASASPPHPESVLYAAAWLTGTSLHQALKVEQQLAAPAALDLSARLDEEWPKLMRTFIYLLEKFGIKVKTPEPDLHIAPEHRSGQTLRQIQEALQVPYNAIMTAHGFDYAEGARTGAVACALLVRGYCGTHKVLAPDLAAGIVAAGFVEAAKTAPAPLS